MKKHIVLISVGVLNVLHGSFHIIQFIQSMFFVAYATHDHHEHNHHDGIIETIMHHPIFALLMGIIGILTLVIGIRDYRHHKKCETHEHHEPKEITLEEEYELTMNKLKTIHRSIKDKDKDNGGSEYVFWE